jgi:predicted PurR-regulated permease PerM
MFIVVALPLLAVGIIASILSFIPVLGFILIFVLLFLMNFVNIGIQASLYKRLTGNV